MIRSILLPALIVTWAAPALAQTQVAPQISPFDRADANRDGTVSRGEFVAARSARFDQIDHNHDGVIDRKDFPGMADHKAALARLDAQISTADTNSDGSVTRKELASAATPFFDRVDTNHDGVIGQAEAMAFRQAVAARRKAAPR